LTWPTILAIGLATYLIRASFLFRRTERSGSPLERYLRYVPAAVLPILAVSATTSAVACPIETRLAAVAVGVAVAWKTRNVGAVMLVGMTVLWVLNAWAGS